MQLEQMNEEQILSEAMKQGYNPDYDGDNKKSPKEYLEVSFNHNKMLKERNEKLSEKIEQLNDQIERLVSFQTEQKNKAVQAAIEQLKVERREAITDGDHEKVEQIDEKIQAEQQSTVANSQHSSILNAWLVQNPWYKSDENLAIEADIIAQQLFQTGRFSSSNKDYEKLLSIVESKVKSQFSDHFKNPKKDNPPEVDSGEEPHISQVKHTYAELPPEAKRACDGFVRDKIMTKEQYLEIYEWD